MAKEQIIKFAIDDLSRFSDDQNAELAIGRMLFLSTRPNTHRLNISEQVLRKYAPSIIGKWVIAEYDKWTKDVTTHTQDQVIVGIVPHDAKVTFVRAEDGYLDAYVDCVISKLYATQVYDIFLKDNFRSVSVEMSTDVDPSVGGDVHVLDIKAVSLLGRRVNPSVPHANIKIVQFSEKDANEYYSIWANLDNTTVNKGESMKKDENAILDNKETEVQEPIQDAQETVNLAEKDAQNEENIVMGKEEDAEPNNEEVATQMSEDDKNDDDDNDANDEHDDSDDKDDDADKSVDFEAQLAEKDAEIAQLKADYDSLKTEHDEIITKFAELEKFKADAEEEKKMEIVTATLAQVKDYMSEDVYKNYSDKANVCKFADITAWRNEVLANVTTDILNAKMSENNNEHINIDIPQEDSNKGLWD